MSLTNIRSALLEQHRNRKRKSWWTILKLTASQWMQDDAMTLAAAVACYTLLALAPMLVIAIKVATLMLGGQAQAIDKIQSQVHGWMGQDAAQAIAPVIAKIIHKDNGRLAAIVSIVLVVFGVGGLFSELQQAMNRIWKLEPKPGTEVMTFVRARVKSVFVMIVAAIVLVASVVVTAWLQDIGAAFGVRWQYSTTFINAVVSVGVLAVLFAFFYKTIPDAEIEWGTTAVGAIISAILFEVGKVGLACYFRLAAPSSAYGAAGSLAAVLIWVYYSAQIVFFGAEFTQVYAKTRGTGVRPSSQAQLISTCDDKDPPDPPNLSERIGDPEKSNLGDVHPVIRNGLAAGAGLVVGAVAVGLSAIYARRSTPADDGDGRNINERIRQIERKLGPLSEIKRRVVEERLNARMETVANKVFAASSFLQQGKCRTGGAPVPRIQTRVRGRGS